MLLRQRLEEAFGEEISLGDEDFEVFYKLSVQFSSLAEDSDVVLETMGEVTVADSWLESKT